MTALAEFTQQVLVFLLLCFLRLQHNNVIITNGSGALLMTSSFMIVDRQYFILENEKKSRERIKEGAIPRSGGRGGRRGRRTSPTSFPPIREQKNTAMMPNRFPPGRHSFSVMDQTTPNNTAAMAAGHTHTHTDLWARLWISSPCDVTKLTSTNHSLTCKLDDTRGPDK